MEGWAGAEQETSGGLPGGWTGLAPQVVTWEQSQREEKVLEGDQLVGHMG